MKDPREPSLAYLNAQGSVMKSPDSFQEQISLVTAWFQCWNTCEQTVALYYLLRKVALPQAKFLSQALSQWLTTCSTEYQALEAQANSAAFIKCLFNEPKEIALKQLLACLPLLSAGHNDAKANYMELIPKLLSHSIEKACHIEESRQLLSYWLIHPALSPSERAHFKLWLSQLEECSSSQRTVSSSPDIFTVGSTSVSALSKSSCGLQDITNTHHNVQRLPVSNISSRQDVAEKKEVNANNVTSVVSDYVRAPRAIVSSTGQDVSVEGHVGRFHRPLHATHSGPPAFTNLPVSGSNSGDGSIHRHGVNMSLAYPVSPATVSPPASSHNTMHPQQVPPHPGTHLPGQHVSHWLNQNQDFMVGKHDKHKNIGSVVDSMVQIGHAPLSPQSSEGSSSSGSENCREETTSNPSTCPPMFQMQHQRNTFLDESSGMRDVPIWLKSLRLHKYSMLFQTLAYEEMLNLTEEWLEQQNVTKGARNKIILSIKKLRSRQSELRVMEKEIMESCHLKQALADLKVMMNTPIKAHTPDTSVPPPPLLPTSDPTTGGNHGNLSSNDVDSIPDGDLPSQITRVLGKLCTQLLISSGRIEDECYSMYFQLLDKCAAHEAFTTEQKKKVFSWKLQMQKVWQPPSQKYVMERQKKIFALHNPLPIQLLRSSAQRPVRGQQTMVAKPGQPKWTFNTRAPTPVGTPSAVAPPVSLTLPLVNSAGLTQAGTINALYRNNSFNTAFSNRPGMLEVKQPVTRTHSAPMRTSQYPVSLIQRPGNQEAITKLDDNTDGMDGLCSSMAKHALGSFGESL